MVVWQDCSLRKRAGLKPKSRLLPGLRGQHHRNIHLGLFVRTLAKCRTVNCHLKQKNEKNNPRTYSNNINKFYGQSTGKNQSPSFRNIPFWGNTTDKEKVKGDSILSVKKQNEIEVVLKKLEAFKPEKIYVENPPNRQKHWDSIYKAHKQGKAVKLKTELYQIGIKLAARLNLKQGITCVNWVYEDSSYTTQEYLNYRHKIWDYDSLKVANRGPDKQSKYLSRTLKEVFAFNDSIPKLKMIAVYRKLNTKKAVDRMFYANVSGMIDKDRYNENIFWSQNAMLRNVHIYQNIIQDIIKEKPKRVLVLFGQAHIKPLTDYLKVHPMIKIVNTEKILE